MLCGSFVTMALSFLRKRKEKKCSFDVQYVSTLNWLLGPRTWSCFNMLGLNRP